MEAARLKARERLGADVTELNVLRHGRELYGGIFGFFQRERYVIELGDPAQARDGSGGPTGGPFRGGRIPGRIVEGTFSGRGHCLRDASGRGALAR